MDCACFTFLVIQYRVFTSDYFKHVVRDHREQSDMASRYVNPLVLQLRPDSSMGKALNCNVRLVLFGNLVYTQTTSTLSEKFPVLSMFPD